MRQKFKTPNQLGLFGQPSRPKSFKWAGLLRTISTVVAGLSLASVAAPAATFVSGYLNYEYYPGAIRDDVNNGTVGAPSTAGATLGSDKSGPVPVLESGTNFAENYANRFNGYFIPPTTGDYVFFIAADDDSDLFLSTDATAANKKLIAQEAGWSAVRSYLTIGGTSLPEDKRSDTFAGSEWTTPGKITLTAGQKYYIEAVHHEGGGGDNIAVTYKLASEPDPKNGDAPRLTGSVIGFDAATAPAAANISISVQPVGGTFYASSPMTLVVGVTSDSTYPVAYQWRKNGTAIAGATSSSYSVAAPAAADAGSYDVLASVPGPTGSPLVVTSTPVNVTVTTPQIAQEVGKIRYEYFPNGTRTGVEAGQGAAGGSGPAGNDGTGFISIAESGTNFADNYANRMSGYFLPPTTGDYVFYIAGDDDSDLFLSTDATAANKKLIAQESGWSGVRVYNNVGGGSSIENKRSDSFANSEWPGGGATIHLTQGQRYYWEAVHHEGGGGDNLAVTYRLTTEDESLTADGTAPRLTGPVVAVDVPKIFSFSSISSASISSLKFSIADSAPSILDPASVKVTFDGQPLPATAGTKGANGVTPFTATYPTQLAQGSTHIFTLEAKDTNGQPLTQSGTFTIGFQVWPKEDLVGAPVAEKKINSRFIFNVHNQAAADPSALVQITGLANIFNILKAAGTPGFTDGTGTGFTGTIVDVVTNRINYNNAGFIGGEAGYPDEVTANPDWTAEDFINLNIMNIVIPEESDYTFGVHSDDGFAMRIRGGQTVSISGAGQLDPTDPEAVIHPADTGDSNTRAVYHLKKGIYRLEFFWWERGGGDNGEFYAAKGAFANDGDTPNWRLVGDPTPSQELTLLGVDTAGWTVISSDPGGDPLNTWADADADLAATGGGAKTYDRLFVGDPESNGGVDPFPKNTPNADDDWALKATANLVVPEAGTYLIGFNTDDGGYMKIAGQTFTAIQQNNTGLSVLNGDTVTCDCLTGDSGTTATITLAAGTYPIEVGQFERGGGGFLAARGAKLPANPITTSDMPFLAKGAAGSKVTTIQALQTTSAPADGGSGGGGGGDQPKLTITRNGNSITITSDKPGTVQSKNTLGAGAWTNVGPAPQTVTIGTGSLFFRVQAQ